MLLKSHAEGQLPNSNSKIGKSNTPIYLPLFSKYCMNVHPLYKIFVYANQNEVVILRVLNELNQGLKGVGTKKLMPETKKVAQIFSPSNAQEDSKFVFEKSFDPL